MPKFIETTSMEQELIELFHTARTALAGGDDSRWGRLDWAAKAYHKAHPEVSVSQAYKTLSRIV